jgi:hypothetical protein
MIQLSAKPATSLVRRHDAHLLAMSRSLVIPLPPWFALSADSQAPRFSTHSERGEGQRPSTSTLSLRLDWTGC